MHRQGRRRAAQSNFAFHISACVGRVVTQGSGAVQPRLLRRCHRDSSQFVEKIATVSLEEGTIKFAHRRAYAFVQRSNAQKVTT